MHILGKNGHIHTKQEFLCLTLWLGAMCTDDVDDNDTNDDNDDTKDRQIMIPNEPKITFGNCQLA